MFGLGTPEKKKRFTESKKFVHDLKKKFILPTIQYLSNLSFSLLKKDEIHLIYLFLNYRNSKKG